MVSPALSIGHRFVNLLFKIILLGRLVLMLISFPIYRGGRLRHRRIK